ncbi:hypothetical protein [Nocardioides sp. SYSU DS0651]|uniref:hypothetical protein n=1 Tax=Nocardioides sp. SYSU DS0651 TaxID=3415955 RepID=UPI003F4C6DE4
MTDESTARDTQGSRRLRWNLLRALLGVVVVGLVVSGFIVFGRGAGDGPIEKAESVFDPPTDLAAQREDVLAASRTFVQRFNSYGPDLLNDSGKMPDYAAVGELMTPKFRTVFDKNVGYAEQTVAETGISRKGTVYGVGVASMDADSAEALVAGTVEFSYPNPEDSDEEITFEPRRFRYQVSLVRVDGKWLVDDLDDVDDSLPSFGEASIPETGAPGGTPTEQPSGSPSGGPSGSPSPESGSPGTGETR